MVKDTLMTKEPMEHPICPNCGYRISSIISEQKMGKSYRQDLFEVLEPTGVWEHFCGTCFGDVDLEFAQMFADFPIQCKPTEAPPKPNSIERIRLLCRREGEDQETWATRNFRAAKCRETND